MSNPFLIHGTKDIATAKLYEKAIIVDLEKTFHTNAPALTNGKKIYINTEDNLFKTLPNYNLGMLKWLLWHEEQHLNLKHHDRFFNYIDELKESELLDKFHVTKDEVNIIMDILVHDSLCNWFPELIETAKENYAQLRTRNSLEYTFKTYTLEEMLDEYAEHKKDEDDEPGKGESESSDDKDDKDDKDKDDKKDKSKDSKTKEEEEKKAHQEGDGLPPDSKSKEEVEGEQDDPGDGEEPQEEADWSKLKDIDSKEFITDDEADTIERAIQKIRRKKLKLARITETLNGLATDQRIRTYAVPSRLKVGKGVILKGRKPGKAKLYLIFDASGSMNSDMDMFKEIIKNAIPQAMNCPCEWFSGFRNNEKLNYRKEYQGKYNRDYYKGKFKDFIDVEAYSGYNDDGDRVIDLCVLAEEQGYNPIGVTDGGGCLRYPETLKKLKRTILVGDSKYWLEKCKRINPAIQTICTDDDEY